MITNDNDTFTYLQLPMSFFIDEEASVHTSVTVSTFFNRSSELYNAFRSIVLDFIPTCRLSRTYYYVILSISLLFH